jgi:hypothetical protein
MKHRTAPVFSFLGFSAVVALAACSSATSDDLADEASQGASKSYVAGHFALMLGGQFAGHIRSVSGGGILIPQVDTSRVGQPKYGDIKMEISFGMARPVYDWIESSWKADYARKDGSIIAADYNLNAKSEREFFHALVTETVIPACDGSSKEPAYITVKMSPDIMRTTAPTAGVFVPPPPVPSQKVFLPSNFRVEIGNLDTKKVNKVESLTLKKMTVHATDVRGNVGPEDSVVFPDVTIHLPESEVGAWSQWLDASKAAGVNAERKSGSVVYLATDRQTELARVRFENLGILSITPDKAEANDDKIKRVAVRLHPERMTFQAAGVTAERDAGTNR